MPKWRKDSTFGTGRRVRLDRNQRARFLYLARADRRRGRLSSTGQDVAEELVKILGDDGRCDPSRDTLARRIGCHVSTVGECLQRLRELGRITWERRLRRDAATGWRVEQTSNAYVLLPASCEAGSAPAVSLNLSKKEAQQESKRPETDFESAARQLIALGYPVPVAWGLG